MAMKNTICPNTVSIITIASSNSISKSMKRWISLSGKTKTKKYSVLEIYKNAFDCPPYKIFENYFVSESPKLISAAQNK